MNPFTMKAVCAAYHKKAAADLTINSVDLFLVAANNALKRAEQKHNFEFTRATASLAIDGATGGSLDNAVIYGGVEESLLATGGTTPNTDGTYTKVGSFASRFLYVLAGATTFYCYYNLAVGAYIVATSLTNADPVNYFVASGPFGTVLGTYNPIGTYVGHITMVANVPATWGPIKEVVACLRTNVNGTYVPLDFTRDDIPVERDRTVRELSDNYWPWNRYPSDADILNVRGNATLVQQRRTLFVYPSPTEVVASTTLNILMKVFMWLPKLTTIGSVDDEDPNFFWTYGAEFLQWSIVHELNFYFKTWVPRTEGNLPSPTDMRDSAWEDLILWDSYQIDANSTRSR